MIRIQQECNRRGVTRLCHFTQSRNLAHILGDSTGILSRRRLESTDLPHNPTDPNRYDGCEHLVCCTLEYPNPFYFARVRDSDHLFKDWVVLILCPDLIWASGTYFCPCNAATARGAYIGEGYDKFASIFLTNPPGSRFSRSTSHLLCSPTDIQAEVLVTDPIPLDAIMAIAVESEDQANREICRAELQGLTIDRQIIIAPDFYNKTYLSSSIQRGIRVNEAIYNYGGRHVQ